MAWTQTNVTFENLTFDANNNLNVTHNMPNIIFMRGCTNLSFINVCGKFMNANYSGWDDHLCNNLVFNGCSAYVGGSWNPPIFLGTSTQVFIENCNFYGAYNNITYVDEWGTTGFDMTGCTFQDSNINNPTNGWGEGRLMSGNDLWAHSRYTYFQNTSNGCSVSPSDSNQNTGEQYMWEGNNIDLWQANPTSATSTTVTFANLTGAPLSSYAGCEACIVSGTGHERTRGRSSVRAAKPSPPPRGTSCRTPPA